VKVKFISLLVCTLSLACSVKQGEVVPAKNHSSGESVGPYDLKITPNENSDIINTFAADIYQAKGRVEFFLNPTLDMRLKLSLSETIVTGCNAENTLVTHYWLRDSNDLNSAKVIREGDVVMADVGKRALLVVAYEGLDGCSKIEYKMVIKDILLPPSKWDANVEERLLGRWEYKGSSSHRILLTVSQDSMGFLESNGSGYICDKTLSIKSAASNTPKWMRVNYYGMDCTYKIFNENNKPSLELSCEKGNWPCGVPAKFRFWKL